MAKWVGVAILAVALLAIGWATWVTPPWGTMQPTREPVIVLLSSNGTPIARRGGREAPIDAATLPAYVRGAFIAIEDRRFRRHHGIDPRGLTRAFWRNARAGRVIEGGSTITQQLAKADFLTADREIGRKIKESVLAIWLDAWLSKDEILSRYLSSIYFGDGVWGLRAAARHYFQKAPESLSISEAAMLAGMVKAPSRLNPTRDLRSAQARSRLVLQAMADEGIIAPASLPDISLAVSHPAPNELPVGTYFADWIAPRIEQVAGDANDQITVRTTLDARLQKAAIRALTSIMSRQGAVLHATQGALVAMRPDGEVVAMVGGRSYKSSPFNRATQASRQPGSAFKLAVYLAAFENGYTPDTLVEDGPLSINGWSPRNYGDRYGSMLPLRDAFAHSSNVAAVRIAEQVGRGKVAAAAKQLGINSPIASGPSMALGSSSTTLIELTAAYAAIASGQYGITPHGLLDRSDSSAVPIDGNDMDPRTREAMLDLLWTASNQGTGHAASLSIPTFGKTGTTQNYRDALFIGFAGGLITGVWVGNDDNSPMRGVTGGTLPAQIWHDFMDQADLNAADLRLPMTLQAAIVERSAAMRAAAEEQAREQLDQDAADQQPEEDEPGLLRFLEPLIPKFLRPDGDNPQRDGLGRGSQNEGARNRYYDDRNRRDNSDYEPNDYER